MTKHCKVLPILRAHGLTDHEAVAAVKSTAEAGNSRLAGKRAYELLSGDEPIATVRFNSDGRISSIDVLTSVWQQIYPAIEADCATERYGVARSIIFSSRPLKGFARAPSWLQLRPVACELRDARFGKCTPSHDTLDIPFPVVTEVTFRRSGLLLVDGHRRFRSVQEAHWLLSAFIDVPIFGFSGSDAWAFLEGTYQLVSFGMGTGLEDETEDDFSCPGTLQELQPIPSDVYYSQLGITEHDLRVPDLADLHGRYCRLDPDSKARFLRASAALWSASQPGVSRSQRLVSLVSALEPLLETPERCPTCWSSVGITKSFRRFLDAYVTPPSNVKHVYEVIYGARSRVVHGGWNFEVDEPFTSVSNQGYITSLAAWGAAKRGIVNWLLAH